MNSFTLALLVMIFTGFSCSKLDRIKKEPVTIKFTQANLFPEGVVYDPFNNYFLVSSITRGDIGRVAADGTYTPFITDDALVSSIGLEIDKNRKRLLVANSSMVKSMAQLAVYNSNTGARIKLVDLGALLPAAAHFANDIAIDKDGNAYVTDSFSPVIYKVDPQGNASIFFQNDDFETTPGQFGFNGIEYHPAGFLLVNFSARNELVKISISKPSAYSIVALNAPLNSPDGMLISKDGKKLIIVNNAGGAEGKVISFSSDNKWETGYATDAYKTGRVFPTTATSDGKKVYTLYAYLHILMSGGTQNTFTIQELPFPDAYAF